LAIQPNKPQNRVFLIVGIVLAAAAAAAVLFAVSGTVSKNNVPTSNVVVAKSSIAAGTSITPDLLTTAPLAQGSFPADSFTDPNQAVGKIAPVTLSANIPLTASLFASATTGTTGTGVVSHLDITKGYVALAIPAGFSGNSALVGEQMSVGYYIQPEDHIDILIDSGAGGGSVRYALQDVRVLRVGAASVASTSVGVSVPSRNPVRSRSRWYGQPTISFSSVACDPSAATTPRETSNTTSYATPASQTTTSCCVAGSV